MRWIYAALAAVSVGAIAQAQTTVSSTGVTQADLDAAIVAATPNACSTPLPDTLTGSAGTQPVCMARPDATRPTVIQAKNTTTATDATWAVTFDRPFASIPVYVDARVYGINQPYLCTVGEVTITGASGKCFQLVATTLPTVTTSLLGLVVSPVATAGAGFSVRVVARQ